MIVEPWEAIILIWEGGGSIQQVHGPDAEQVGDVVGLHVLSEDRFEFLERVNRYGVCPRDRSAHLEEHVRERGFQVPEEDSFGEVFKSHL